MAQVFFKVNGKSFYSNLSKANKKGKYGVGITDIEKIMVNCEKGKEKALLALFNDSFLKTNKDGVVHCSVSNSNYPLSVQDKDGNPLGNVYIKNGFPISVVFELRRDSIHGKDFCVVNAIKLLEEYKKFNPFNDIEFTE